MDREFLQALGIAEESIEEILKQSNEEISRERLINSAQSEFSKRGVKNINAAMKLFDFNGIEGDNLIQKIDEFTRENDFLFENDSPKPIFSGTVNNEKRSSVTKEEFSKMGYIERLKLFNENPDNYRQLTE